MRRLVAAEFRLPAERLKLVLRGKTLRDKKEKNDADEDVVINLEGGGKFILSLSIFVIVRFVSQK